MTRSLARLLSAELLRLRSRRAILLLLAAAVVVPAVIALGVAFSTRPPSDTARAGAQAAAEAAADEPFVAQEQRRCERRPAQFGVARDLDATDLAARCAEAVAPQAEDYLYVDELDLAEERDYGSGLAVAVVLGASMFLVGTTFAGHDWNSGSMSNQLLFEPRRLRVLAAKTLAVGLVSALVATLVLTAYWLGLAAVASSRDLSPAPGVLLDCLQAGWRGAGLATVAGVGGVLLTMLSRSTVFSLGLVLGLSLAGGVLLLTLGPDDPGPVEPTVNALAVLQDGYTYYVAVPDRCFEAGLTAAEGDPCDPERVRTFTEGATWYAGLVLVVGAASAVSFRRRDVP